MNEAAAGDAEALRAEIRRLAPWHHDIEVAPGVRTGEPLPPGTAPPELGIGDKKVSPHNQPNPA